MVFKPTKREFLKRDLIITDFHGYYETVLTQV